jgi:hypothetical protein
LSIRRKCPAIDASPPSKSPPEVALPIFAARAFHDPPVPWIMVSATLSGTTSPIISGASRA